MENQLDNTLKKAVAEPNLVVQNYWRVYKHVQTGAVYSSQRIKTSFNPLNMVISLIGMGRESWVLPGEHVHKVLPSSQNEPSA